MDHILPELKLYTSHSGLLPASQKSAPAISLLYTQLADLCATNAAKRFGLYPRKGAVRVGADADLALVDMDCRWNYSRKNSLSKTKCTSFPYEGKEVLCRVTETLVRGRTVYRDGAIWAVPGSGIFIKP